MLLHSPAKNVFVEQKAFFFLFKPTWGRLGQPPNSCGGALVTKPCLDAATKDKKVASFKTEFANITLNLYLNGDIITVKRSTLCLLEDSVLAKQFSDDKWIEAQKIKLENR